MRWCSQIEYSAMSRTSTISSWSASNVTTRWLAGSCESPEQISAYMSATRAGVRSKPSRSGSSPIAARISRTARAIRSRSTGGAAPGTARSGWASVMLFLSLRREIAVVLGDEREIAVALPDVEAVSDHEPVGYTEADVLEIRVDALQSFLHEQRADLERRGVAGPQVLAQVRESETGVDDVFHDQHVPVGEIDVEVLHDPHDAAGARRGAVRRHRHEVELHREVDRPGEIGHEHAGALENADQQGRMPGVVGREVLAQLADALLEVVLVDDDPADVGIVHPRASFGVSMVRPPSRGIGASAK